MLGVKPTFVWLSMQKYYIGR